MSDSNAVIAGVGMIPFAKAGRSDPYNTMGAEAARRALADAGLAYTDVQRAYAGYIYGDSMAGEATLYGLGLTGIPIMNVHNNCSSGSAALLLAREAVESGLADVALAVGFEQMEANVEGRWPERPHPLTELAKVVVGKYGMPEGDPGAALFYGAAGKQYVDDGVDPRTFAQIAVKARKHAAANPYAVFRDPLTVGEVLASRAIYGPLTKFQCCPPSSGAAAAVVVSKAYAAKHGLRGDVVIAGQAMETDSPSTFEGDMKKLISFDLSAGAAKSVYEQSGIGPDEVDVVELHDCFTTHEFLIYEALGLTPEGTAERFVLDGDNTYGGKVVTNPSGGLLSRGHPIGATGLAQCAELVWQLRGSAQDRQVQGARVALQHNVGLGGAAVVTMYRKVSA
ncbi:thiolase C-terminal domain-containing protein [Nonomuraea mesophila]|uniref:thiolase C-terminal domain-containing protein n=1 Tax=Nonomuraea mesophila TaxID=2530382 RepID=UPI001C702206|nr:beta-ketoacyl synthase N-terminal-like domain-containing protein [Nonomuraea mesophila]